MPSHHAQILPVPLQETTLPLKSAAVPHLKSVIKGTVGSSFQLFTCCVSLVEVEQYCLCYSNHLLCVHLNYKLGYFAPHFKTGHMQTFNTVSVKISFLVKHTEHESFVMNMETNCTSNFFFVWNIFFGRTHENY